MPDDPAPRPPSPPQIPRVIASYGGVPCAKLRPLDAPTRPGEECGEIHTSCRGHVRRKDHPRYGDPCWAPALLGLCTCRPHGGQLPEARAVNQRAKAQRAYGRVTGSSAPVEDPVRLLAELAGEMRTTQQGLRELVAQIQERGGDQLSIEAGAAYDDEDGGVGQHPAVTGEGLVVRTPAGAYALHPLFAELQAMEPRLGALLASMAKLGIEERLVRLEEAQIDQTLAVLRRVFEMLPGVNPDDALGLFFKAARDADAIDATVSQAVQAHVVRTLPDEVPDLREPDPGTDGRSTTATIDPPPHGPVWP